MKTINVGNAALLFIILFTGIIFTCSCFSNPQVKSAAISGEVRAIDNWKLIWEDSLNWAASRNAGLYGHDLTLEFNEIGKFCQKFIIELEDYLSEYYDFSFYENHPGTGLLKLQLFPSRIAMPIGFKIVMNRVRVTAVDEKGKSMGEIWFGDELLRKNDISPGYVARRIHKLLKYGPAPRTR